MNRWHYVALGLGLASAGCGRQDAEKLARVGWRVTEKVQSLVPERTLFTSPWGSVADPGVEARVRIRLESDRFLAPTHIEVIATPGGVRLRGTVEDEVLRRRAVEMAESTVGVEKVVNELSDGN